MESTLIEMNEYLTPLTLETLSNLPEEVKDELLETINSILFIKNLISPSRRYAKDMPKDSLGRIIVDLLNPHILEDMDYFRLPALHFMEHGCYTFLRPNSNPNSEYRRYWDEEIRRCREGYIRESDGEWVTGYLYWFLNYCPMMINKVVPGTKKAIRVESFPFFFEGIYWRFHYLHLARESGKHAIELAKRGAHPYFLKVFTPDGWKNWGDIKIGDKLYSTDNNVCTVIDIPYDKVSPYYKITLRDGREVYATDDHLWNIIRKNNSITVNTAWLLSNYKTKRKTSYRIPSGIEYTCYIPKNNGVDIKERNTLVEPYTFGLLLGDGCFTHKCCYYTLIKEDFDIERQYIPYGITKWKDKYSYKIEIPNWREILSSYNLLNAKSKDKFIPDEFKYNSRDVRLKLLMGLLDTDGSIHGGVPILNSASRRLIDDALFIARSLGYNTKVTKSKSGYYNLGVYRLCLDSYELAIYGGEELFRLPRKKSRVHYNSNNSLSRKLKTCIVNIEYIGEAPCKCVTVDSKDSCYLIGDFITTHNCAKSYSLSSIMSHNLILGESEEAKKRVITVLTAYLKEYLSDSKDGTLSKFKPSINFSFKHTPFPRLLLKNSPNEMAWLMGYKDEFGVESGSLNLVLAVSAKDDSEKLRGKRGWILFEEMGCHIEGTEVLMYDTSFKKVEEINNGDLLMGKDGTPRIVSDVHSGIDNMYKITLSNGDWHIVNSKHLVHVKRHLWYKDTNLYLDIPAEDLYKIKNLDGFYIEKANILYPYKEVKIDPYLLGLWLGDGDTRLVSIANEDKEVLDWLSNSYLGHIIDLKLSNTCKVFYISTKNKIYEDFKYYNLFGNKHVPNDYIYNSRDVGLLLLAGLIDTDGNLSVKKHSLCFEITQRYNRKLILDAAKAIATNLGLRCTMSTRISTGKKPGVLHYRLKISGDISIIPTKIKRKLADSLIKKYRSRLDWNSYTFKIEPYKESKFYGFEVDKDNLFVLKDGTITHNSFKGLLSLYDITRKSVEDGDYTFAIMYLVGCVCAGTKVWTLDGRNINIEDLKLSDGIIGFTNSFTTNTIPNISLSRGITKEPIVNRINTAKKECVSITLSNKNNLRCSIDHPILILKLRMNHDGSIRYYDEVFKRAGDLKIGDRVIESRYVPIFGKDTLFDARLVGMLIGDGSYGLRLSPKYSSEDKELLDYIKDKYNWSLIRSCTTKNGNKYEEIRVKNICPYLREVGIYGLVKLDKRLPTNYLTLTREDSILLLSGLYDTDGSIWFNKGGYISLTLSNRDILELVKILWRKFGIIGTIVKTNPRILPNRKDKNPWFSLIISGRYNCLIASEILSLLVPHKRDKLNFIKEYYNNNPSNKELSYPKDILVYKVTSIENIGLLDVYNLTAGLSHTYLANNIVTHNTAAEDESDFSSAKTLLYNPDGYNILAINNVYDRPKLGKSTFGFFFPSYINRAGCYNKDGVSDIIKALIEILLARYKAKYSADPRSVLRVIAEDPITPAEAIIKTKASYFPTVALTERLTLLDSDPNAFDDVYIGNFITVGGNIEFRISNDIPIRRYGVDNSTTGAIEIFEMPEKLKSGENFNMRYIIGHDPVDNDLAESSSLSSTFVFDLFTDRIVAEYTGRQPFADDNFEIVRLLCLFYNAKCMYEAHPYSLIVPTPNGFKKWGDIKIGDKLFSPTKGETTVVDIPIDNQMPIYKVTLTDGRIIEASDNHIWLVYKGTSRIPVECTTKQMMKAGLVTKHGQHKFFIQEHNGVEYQHNNLPIDPYTMGLILSEGSIRGSHCTKNIIQISSSSEDMEFYKRNIPYEVTSIGSKGFSWHIKIPNCKLIMQEYNLYGTNSHTKFIPIDYLQSNRVQRMELLKGLMDGDGCARTRGASIFVSCSKRLASDVLLLARSLGIKAWLQPSRSGVYRVAIASVYKVFKLPRKVVEQHIYKPYTKGSKASAIINKTAIASIEYSHIERGKCITVDSEDGLYLIGDYVVTHNCNKKGLYGYFSKMNCTHLLADTPEYLRDKLMIKYSAFGSNAKGINASAAINNYANNLIRDWLLLPVPTIIKEDGLDKLVNIPRLYSIRNRALLEELISYTPELNVDRIRALGMVMLYRLEKIILYGENLNAKSLEEISSSYLGNDPFFLNNYRLGIQ